MFQTNAFKTRTKMIARQNPTLSNVWPVAIDVGYSSVKVFSSNMIACFPSYARKLEKGQKFLGEANNKNILYEDENGEIWLVGMYAQNMVSANEASSAASGLFIRDRFSSPMFKVITRVGLAFAMQSNKYGSPLGKTLAVQTGLPPKHMDECTQDLKEVLEGEHSYRIKIGESDWQELKFTLPAENIFVMEQPMGSLIAVSTDRNGGLVPDAKKYLTSNVLVADPGFGTADTFNICERRIINNNTWEDLGMNRVLTDTCRDIYDEFHEEISVPAIQKNLESGTIRVKDRKLRKSKDQSFAHILERNSKNVCEEFLHTLDENYNGLFDHDYLIITGGLGSAWSEKIKNYYSGIETLKVINATINDDSIDGLFSNVRGYYMNLLNNLKKLYK